MSRRIVVLATLTVVLGAAPLLANFAGTDVFIPSLGHGPGSAGAQWYACIWVHNPNASPVNVTFRLLLRDQANPAAQAYNETIPAGDTRRYDDALATLFGVTTKTFGAVRVTTPAGQPVIVNARSYNQPAGYDDMDTTGQFYAAIPASFAIGPGQKTQLLGVYQTTPQNTSQFRYNYGFVETTGNPVTVRVTALDETGAQVGSPRSYTLGGYQASQYNITDLLPQVGTTNVRLEVAVTSGPGQVVAFGSGVANRSNDPSTFEMSFRDELLAANSPGGGLASVAHDGTLTGDGTVATPLGIANAGVSKIKLSAAGGTSGQVLGTDGANLVWQTAGGSGGGITGVTAGTGLTGGGNSGSVTLGIANGGVGNAQLAASAVSGDKVADGTIATADLANGAVTQAKLAVPGGTGGQVLGTDGSNLAWQSAAGLTLPYSGSTASGGAAFSLANTGSGVAMSLNSNTQWALNVGSTAGSGILSDAAGSYGVWAIANGSAGVGVRGESPHGVGVSGFTAGGQYGVYGESDRTNGYGVYGGAPNGTMNAGVYGAGAAGTGVFGQASSGFGVYGSSETWTGVNGIGVNGVAGLATTSAGKGVGGYGFGSGIGVYGESASGYAVVGVSSAAGGVKGDGGNIGVYAHNSTVNGHDVYIATPALAIDAYGDVNVRGNLAKSSGSFRIDHPLDPANKYLAHSFVESPDMMNVYNGNVVTDADGVAVVELPAYFEALNRDFRYQLTVIGRFAQAIVEKEVEANRFTIRTNLADVKVSWQVTGIRKDPWAEAHRIVVEESKADADRGRYIHPELYGQPAEKSVGRIDAPAPQ